MESNNWSKEEMIAYILLFAANSNFIESNKERNIIISKVDMDTFQRIHDEFGQDNDYQSLQKIQNGLIQHNYTPEHIDQLLTEIKLLFYADGEFDHLEQHMFLYLKRIMRID